MKSSVVSAVHTVNEFEPVPGPAWVPINPGEDALNEALP